MITVCVREARKERWSFGLDDDGAPDRFRDGRLVDAYESTFLTMTTITRRTRNADMVRVVDCD